MQNKQRIYGMTLVILLLCITAGIILFTKSPSQTSPIRKLPIVTPVIYSPSPDNSQPRTNPGVSYNQQAEKNVLDKVKNKQQLSASNSAAKQTIVTTITNPSGSVYEANTFRIDYVKTADEFQVEILSPDIMAARQAAETWFLSRGISQSGICNLPVIFYLNFDVANQLRGKNIEFNPAPDGCS